MGSRRGTASQRRQPAQNTRARGQATAAWRWGLCGAVCSPARPRLGLEAIEPRAPSEPRPACWGQEDDGGLEAVTSAGSGNTQKRMLSTLSCHSNTRSHGARLLRLGAQGRGHTERPPTGFSRLGAQAVQGPWAGAPPKQQRKQGCRLGVPDLHMKLLKPEI